MQFCQPGFSSYGKPYAYNAPFLYNSYPEVIGEGNVTTMIAPDGSLQYLFVPSTQWWQPNPSKNNTNNPYCNPTGVWYIRSVFNPTQPMPCQVPLHNCGGLWLHKTSSSNCSVPKNPLRHLFSPSYEVQFHNDNCTSTSDMHYFYPSLRPQKVPDKCNASVQFSEPIATVQYNEPIATHHQSPNVYCMKPCKCAPPPIEATKKILSIQSPQTSIEKMSCDSDKSNTDCSKCQKAKPEEPRKQRQKCKCKKKGKATKIGTSNVCACKDKYKDKSVTTYSDQACGTEADTGRQTQTTPAVAATTACGAIPLGIKGSNQFKNPNKDIKIELWLPNKRSETHSSCTSRLCGSCETCTCTSTSSCRTDAE